MRLSSGWRAGARRCVVALGAVYALSMLDCAHTNARQPKAAALQAAGAASLARGQLDRAAGQFALALEYEPRLAEAENGLGLVALAYGDRELAEHHFRAALAGGGGLAGARRGRGGGRRGRRRRGD